jgi:small subunit ribosomal protein S20
MRQSAEARDRNRAQRSQLRTAVKKARTAAGDQAAMAVAEKTLDRAGRKRLIHPNAAARLKSRLAKAADKK